MGTNQSDSIWIAQDRSKYKKALRILCVIAASVFIGETAVMFLLPFLPPMDRVTEALVDASLLILLISPTFYFFLMRPVLRELEARAKAEARVEKSRTILQAVFDGISDPLIYLDENCIVKVLNRAARDYYDIDPEKAIGESCFKALRGETEPCKECQVPDVAKSTERLTTFERKSPFRPGVVEQLVVYHTSHHPKTDGSIIVRISDITEAKLMEKNLIQREKMASLGLLISGVAHEINNPNNFIVFNLPILRDYIDELLPIADAYQREHGEREFFHMSYKEFRKDIYKLIDNIDHGAKRIDRIVSQLKEFIRMGRRHELMRVNPKSVIEKAVTICSGEINRKVSHFHVDIEEELPEITTDPYAIEQILINLLINAAQASDKSDAFVRLEVTAPVSRDKHLLIRVSDNGCGMDPETLKRIFDPLYTTKEGKSGTGLGLYVCHTLIEGLGGSIDVTSRPGVGSEFKIQLPMMPHKAAEGATPDAAMLADSSARL